MSDRGRRRADEDNFIDDRIPADYERRETSSHYEKDENSIRKKTSKFYERRSGSGSRIRRVRSSSSIERKPRKEIGFGSPGIEDEDFGSNREKARRRIKITKRTVRREEWSSQEDEGGRFKRRARNLERRAGEGDGQKNNKKVSFFVERGPIIAEINVIAKYDYDEADDVQRIIRDLCEACRDYKKPDVEAVGKKSKKKKSKKTKS